MPAPPIFHLHHLRPPLFHYIYDIFSVFTLFSPLQITRIRDCDISPLTATAIAPASRMEKRRALRVQSPAPPRVYYAKICRCCRRRIYAAFASFAAHARRRSASAPDAALSALSLQRFSDRHRTVPTDVTRREDVMPLLSQTRRYAMFAHASAARH